MFLCKRSICFILENFTLLLMLLNHFLVKISTANIDKVIKMLFSQRWSNANEDTLLTQFSFSTKSRAETTMVHRRWIGVILSTLFCQRWNNVDKCTSASLSFSTKYQHRNKVDERWQSTLISMLIQRWCVCWAILQCQF